MVGEQRLRPVHDRDQTAAGEMTMTKTSPTVLSTSHIAAIRRYVKAARGAIESGQVVDKDVHGTLTKVIEMLDALAATPADESGWPHQFEPMKLQARPPEGGDWIDIFPAQLYAMAKRNDVRALEQTAAATPAVGGEATCYVERSKVREIVIGHNAATQAVLPQIDELPIFTVEDFRTQCAPGPAAWRWRPRGSTNWIYDPTDEWRLDNQDSIEFEPLYAAPPASPLRGRDSVQQALEPFAKIGLDVLKNHEGWANDVFAAQWAGYRLTYLDFKRAAAIAHTLSALPPEQPNAGKKP